ncbi:hypothetical protein I8748_14400 [Nostoc sp. CENA67]|uniref:Uncharacterized protein n=1 Tax=Amazonocrinis nigriterrae CENA67 TaxID=2794033 RepID=A0A8J7L8H5_9NOST|nr:hypothetical protein [Amazonocrinis nigriterrae]MBH8563363.1 hypothetical protein [Amazonocrinis nigriterrae CENA67]
MYYFRVLLKYDGEIKEDKGVIINEIFNLPYIPDLIAQKFADTEKSTLSNIDVTFHQSEYERLRDRLQEAYEASKLPEAPVAKESLHNLLVNLRIRS